MTDSGVVIEYFGETGAIELAEELFEKAGVDVPVTLADKPRGSLGMGDLILTLTTGGVATLAAQVILSWLTSRLQKWIAEQDSRRLQIYVVDPSGDIREHFIRDTKIMKA